MVDPTGMFGWRSLFKKVLTVTAIVAGGVALAATDGTGRL